MSADIEQIVKSSFLNRVPEIMERGGFTIETAIERAYYEEEKMMLELIQPRSEQPEWARGVVKELSNRTYDRIRAEGGC